ncbi:TadE/TadG family type IV pilus assembly protein [uncultured Brevundimonas sp.]|uniref:TadE/TadG family type IV pilus assembly protein n=1 Tax=uncultured Brevundimonas sp. TaxID=213418 RepID=UPI002627FA6B|nr:TadE/TadG family type IV pilus assembly protein [uncultured Brevundimonas sp.]
MRNRDGSAAVEFALVALPFCFMIFAVLEVALIFTLDSVLENAAIDTGRLVRTGQASAQGMTATEFKAQLCSRMSIFSGDCPARASIDVRVIPQFDTTPPDPLAGEGFDPSSLTYANGNPGDLILVRVWYQHPLLTTFLSQGLSQIGDRTAVLTATTAFRNEPAG